MANKTSIKSTKVAKKAAARRVAAKPALLAGGNPQIAKGLWRRPVQAYIAAFNAGDAEFPLRHLRGSPRDHRSWPIP